MSEKQLFRLSGNPEVKFAAVNAVKNAPDGYIVKIEPETRRSAQNANFHALCGDVADQALFMGKKLKPEQWKVLFISGHAIATGLGAEMVPGLEGEFVNIRESSAQMSVKRMASVIEYTLAFCADNGVKIMADKRYQGDE